MKIKTSENLELATPIIEKFNLQLFGEELPDDADIEATENNEGENPGGDPESDESDMLADDNVSEGQSKDKNHPANHTFAEMRRKNKEYEEKIKEYESKQAQIDSHYAELAKKAGRDDIKTEADYRRAIAQEELVNRYKDTQDPMALVELMKSAIMPDIQGMVSKSPVNEYDFTPELTEFNKEFGNDLKSIDEIESLPNADKVMGYMSKNGLSLTEAYKLANGDAVKKATRQEAINRAKGHNHVKDTKQAAETTGHVSKEELETFKRRHGITDDAVAKKEILEIRKYFED